MKSSKLRLALSGDSIVQRRLLTRTDPVVRPLFDLIRGADVALTNLEVLPNDYRGDPVLDSGGSHFGAAAWVVDELIEAGFNLLATATNHSLDYGVSGLLHSLEALRARNVSYAGIGRNLEEARRPVYCTHPRGTVALISCCSSFAKGQEASAQRPDMQGRPGLNPARYETVCEVTSDQIRVVREIAEQLGLEQRRQESIRLGFEFPPDDLAIFPLDRLLFRAADHTSIRTSPRTKDLGEIAKWVREAKGLSDIVLVSCHVHEQGETDEDPAEFFPIFARRFIDEGADVVAGHGPHILRGMEIYKDRPIFYSLGNFIGQNELVDRLPSDSYDRFRADPELTPGFLYRLRSDNDRKGFPSDPRVWETVVPVCSFEEGRLCAIDIYPVSLGLGEKVHLRGRPRLAGSRDAARILQRFATLSAHFGTRLAVGEGVAGISTLTVAA